MALSPNLTFESRRAADRYLLHPPAVAHLDAAGEVFLIDLSVRGARVVHLKPLQSGARVRLKFKAAADSITLFVNGIVVWSESVDPSSSEGGFMTGLQFGEEAIGLRSAIDQLCRHGGATKI